MIRLKTEAELVGMRESSRIAAIVRDHLIVCLQPGITTGELDVIAAAKMDAYGGRSAFLGYRNYPGHICVSLNDEVVHGIPGRRRIKVGDIVSIDVGVLYQGYVGDTATTVIVGATKPDVLRLLVVAREALDRGIMNAVEGKRVSDISRAIEDTAMEYGFSVVRDFVGHGIGRDMHEDPPIPNYVSRDRGPRLRQGMTLAIEPMLNMGSGDVRLMDDRWTVKTLDGKLSAHFEHTVAVGKYKAEILTAYDVDE